MNKAGRYLLLPRPYDLGMKSTFTVIPMLLTLGAIHIHSNPTAACCAVLLFEGGLYQARYLLNDLFGATEDRRHPAAQARNRLAGHLPDATVASALVGRLAATAIGAAFLPPLQRQVLIGAGIALLISTIGYESLRRASRKPTTSHDRSLSLGIYIWVGTGYAVRAVFGVTAVAGIHYPLPLAVLGSAMWATGTMQATMAWTLEAEAFARDPTPSLSGRKAHVTRLATAELPDLRPLATASTLSSPWGAATPLALALTADAALAFGDHFRSPPGTPAAIAAAAGFLAGIAIVRGSHALTRLMWAGAYLAAIAAIMPYPDRFSAVCLVLPAGAVGLHLILRRLDYAELFPFAW